MTLLSLWFIFTLSQHFSKYLSVRIVITGHDSVPRGRGLLLVGGAVVNSTGKASPAKFIFKAPTDLYSRWSDKEGSNVCVWGEQSCVNGKQKGRLLWGLQQQGRGLVTCNSWWRSCSWISISAPFILVLAPLPSTQNLEEPRGGFFFFLEWIGLHFISHGYLCFLFCFFN